MQIPAYNQLVSKFTTGVTVPVTVIPVPPEIVVTSVVFNHVITRICLIGFKYLNHQLKTNDLHI